MKKEEEFALGEVVRSLAGRDAGTNYIIIGIPDENYVILANGKTRFLEKPKKKKIRHIEKLNITLETLSKKLTENQKIYNEEIYSAFKKNNIEFTKKNY